MKIRVLLNGKKAGMDPVRNAIYKARDNSPVDVRVTWEAGDIDRLTKEAHAEGCTRIVAGGGDGTVHEVVNSLMQLPFDERPELALLPLGTANDFATACTIPVDPMAALELAQNGQSYAVDSVSANNLYFINVASGGFGAQITANTPVALKNFLGGGAYTLYGLAQAVKFVPYNGELRLPEQSIRNAVIVGAICNGKQAGGGQQLAPTALIDDGLLDVVGLVNFTPDKLPQVVKELTTPELSGEYVKRFRVPWAEVDSDEDMPFNLDGEPVTFKRIRFEVHPGSIKLVLPDNCPLISNKSN